MTSPQRLLFIGNSHLAAYKQAWTTRPGQWPGIHADFVGGTGNRMTETEIRDGYLEPVTEAARHAFRHLGGTDRVNLADYDGFVITGASISLHTLVNLSRELRWTDLPSVQTCEDLAVMAPRLVSFAAAQATLEARYAPRLGARLARLLRAGSDRPIWIASQPRMSAVILGTRTPAGVGHVAAIRNGDAPHLSRMFDLAAGALATAIDAEFIAQPTHTTTKHILTALPFVEGAVRLTPTLKAPQPKDDLIHANAAYGAAMLDILAERLT